METWLEAGGDETHLGSLLWSLSTLHRDGNKNNSSRVHLSRVYKAVKTQQSTRKHNLLSAALARSEMIRNINRYKKSSPIMMFPGHSNSIFIRSRKIPFETFTKCIILVFCSWVDKSWIYYLLLMFLSLLLICITYFEGFSRKHINDLSLYIGHQWVNSIDPTRQNPHW